MRATEQHCMATAATGRLNLNMLATYEYIEQKSLCASTYSKKIYIAHIMLDNLCRICHFADARL